jgi:hypothetical protein
MVKTIKCFTFLAIFIVLAKCNESQDENESDDTRAVKAAVKVDINQFINLLLTVIIF